MEFTTAELDTLLEAVKEWENSDAADGMLMGLIGGTLMSQGDSEGSEDRARDFMHETQEAAKVKKAEKETHAILLKAKLIQVRRESSVAEIAEAVSNNET